jgi:hypothetical protein
VLWWTSHSGLARSKVKKALGIDEHPIERPLFAAVATIVWFLNIHNWIPISNCYKFDILKVSSLHWLAIGPILFFATVLIVGLVFNILYGISSNYNLIQQVSCGLFLITFLELRSTNTSSTNFQSSL